MEDPQKTVDASSITQLFDGLVGGKGFGADTNFLISKDGVPENIIILLKLFTSCEPNMQLEILNNLICIVVKSTRNQHICQGLGVLGVLIEILPNIENEKVYEKTLLLIEILAKFSISVRQVKSFMAMLSDPSSAEDRKILAITALQNIANKKSPEKYFSFDGLAGGVKLPEFEKWPSSNYSISMWVSIEGLEHLEGSKIYEPRLFSFLTAKGHGVEAYFYKRSLYIRTNHTYKHPVHFTFEPQRWYHIVITHSFSRMEWLSISHSPFRMYIDGKLVADTTLKYPDSNDPVINSYLGMSAVFDTPVFKVPHDNCFYGDMGMFMVFGELLTPAQVTELFQLGCTYSPDFHEKDILTRHNAPQTELMLSPMACEGRTCINLSQFQPTQFTLTFPQKELEITRADLIGGTELIYITDLKDAIHCSAGIQAFFPLFYQLYQQSQLHASLINCILSLLADLLADHSSNLGEMKDCKGFDIIGFLMQKLYMHLNALTVNSVDRLIYSVSSHESLPRDAYFSLFLNFDIWIGTPYSVQKQLSMSLMQHAESNPQFFREQFGIQKFLDILRNYYYFTEESDLKVGRNRNLTEIEIRNIRADIIRAVESLFDTITVEETQPIIFFLQENTDSGQLIDILRLLFNLLSKPVKNLLVSMETLGGLRPLFNLTHKEDLKVREVALKVIGKYLSQSLPKFKLKFFSEFGICFDSDTYPMTAPIYYSLAEILLDEFVFENSTANHSKLIENSKKFYTPQILPSIFRGLEMASAELIEKVLQEFLLCLNHNGANCDAFLEQPGWQGWLLTVMTLNSRGNRVGIAIDKGSVIFEMILGIFERVSHKIQNAKDGWKYAEDTETYMLMFAEDGLIDGVDLLRTYWTNLLNGLEAPIIKADVKNAILWRNVSNMFALIEGFLISHTDSQGKWEDFNLSLKLLDVFDFSLRPPNNDHLLGGDLYAHKKDIFSVVLRVTLLTFLKSYSTYYDDDEKVEVPMSPTTVPNSPSVSQGVSHPNPMHPELEKLFYKNIQRIRHILTGVLNPNSEKSGIPVFVDEETARRLLWILLYLLKVMKRSLKRKDASHLIVVPLIKEILRLHQPVLEKTLGEGYSFGINDTTCFQENAPLADFMNCYSKTISWNFDLLEKLEVVRNEMENENGRTKARYEKNVLNLRTRLKKESALDAINKKKMESECFSLNQKHRTAELERRSTLSILYVERQRLLEIQWKRVWRGLTNDRSCWNDRNQKRTYWKLDSSENHLRQRMLVKRNYTGTSHKEATYTLKGKEIDPELMKSYEDTMDSENLLKALSSINITVLPKKEEDVIEEFDFEDNDLEVSWHMVDQSEENDVTRVAEKILFSVPCKLVNPLSNWDGRMAFTANKIHFFVNRTTDNNHKKKQLMKDKVWNLENIITVQKRRYLLRNNAIEIFFSTHRSYLFDFPQHMRKKVMQFLTKACPGKIEENYSPAELLKKSGYTQKWQRREISTFEYLMKLNTLAGRTYNDLTQYPVFPWVLKDYESKSIDLTNPDVYRDFSKPIGALNPERLERFLERYEAFDDPNIPKFLYGSHYSSIGCVLFFLIRMEPFTTQFLENLQGGKFDIPDRLFHSISSTWNNCLNSPSDVKELIPEFFYQPEFLRNSNEFDLGIKQDGDRVSDVILPPWAKTPEEFVRINREALESDYVSEHIHEWIDLIFGVKQKGKLAETSHNVFYYLTYEGSVDIESIQDPMERTAIESQIANFGQTPSQLLSAPHPKRDPKPGSRYLARSLVGDFELRPYLLVELNYPPSNIFVSGDEIVTLSSHADLNSYKPSTDKSESYAFLESGKFVPPSNIQALIQSPLMLFPVSNNNILARSRFDNGFRVIERDPGNVLGNLSTSNQTRVTQLLKCHKAPVTCFAISLDSSTLITGSADTTLAVWNCRHKNTHNLVIASKPRHLLRGHDDEVTCAALMLDLGICVSGSKDTTVIIHALYDGRYIRSISHPNGCVIHRVNLSSHGNIILYSSADNYLHTYSINGELMCSINAGDILYHTVATRDGEYLVTGGRQIVIRRFDDLTYVTSMNLGQNSKIVSFAVREEQQQIFAVLDNRKLILFAKDPHH